MLDIPTMSRKINYFEEGMNNHLEDIICDGDENLFWKKHVYDFLKFDL